MNDESPFRISSMLLTVACLVCGISAVVFVLPKFIQRSKSVDHSTAAGELQLNLAEFHANQPNSAPEQDQRVPAARRTLLPVSSAIPLKKDVVSNVVATKPSESHQIGGVGSVKTTRNSNFIESTVVDRHAHRWTSPGGSVPQFYAPVTVHPVTVNIDNSGIIREFSRVNERLDALTAEKSRFEKDVMARIEHGNSASPKIGTSVTVVEVDGSAPRLDDTCQQKMNSDVEPLSTSQGVSTKVHTKAANTVVSSIADQTRSNTQQRTVERLKIAERPIALIQESVPAPRSEPVERAVAEPLPFVEPPVEFHPAVNETPEIEFEAELKTHVPDVPSFELPPTESETPEPKTVSEFEHSTEFLPGPTPVTVTPEVTNAVEVEAEPVNVAEPVSKFDPVTVAELDSQSVPEFEITTTTEDASTDMQTATTQTADFPVLPDLAAPDLQSAKRTTDPPFRNGVIARRTARPAGTLNGAASGIQQVKHTLEAAKQPEKQSNPTCHNCGKGKDKSGCTTKAVAPSSPMQRLRSFFK